MASIGTESIRTGSQIWAVFVGGRGAVCVAGCLGSGHRFNVTAD